MLFLTRMRHVSVRVCGLPACQDILYTELTVKENIWFSAALFSRTVRAKQQRC